MMLFHKAVTLDKTNSFTKCCNSFLSIATLDKTHQVLQLFTKYLLTIATLYSLAICHVIIEIQQWLCIYLILY